MKLEDKNKALERANDILGRPHTREIMQDTLDILFHEAYALGRADIPPPEPPPKSTIKSEWDWK